MSTPSLDGRRLRSQHSRQRIVDAMIELVRAGNPSPTADAVATRAGIAMRTVFRHFDDMESLYREIAQRIQGEAQSMLDAPISGATWRQRFENMVDKRIALYQTLEPMKRAADAMRHRSAFLQADHEQFVCWGRERLLKILPDDLAKDPLRVEALDALLSYEFWQRLTRDQKLTSKRARDTIKSVVAGLFDDSGHASEKPR